MKRTIMIVLLASVFSGGLAAQNTPSDEQARALATEAVSKTMGVSKSKLNTKRLEDLEDDLFYFQEKILGRIRKGAYFYRVENGGWQVTPNDVTYTAPSSQAWYVAVSTTDGETFGLFGFKDGDAAFQRLMTKVPVEIKDAVEANIFSKFYLKTVYGNAGNVVYDELRLRHNVEEHFVGYADSQEPVTKKELRFRQWWNGFKATKMTGPLAPMAKAEGNNRFRVEVKILQMTVGRPPELWGWSLEIQKDGAARLADKRPIFPTSPRSSRYDVPVRLRGL